MTNFIGWIVFGLIVGAIAKLIMPGKDPGGFIITILLGIVGALLGGWLSTLMGFGEDGKAAGWIMSILGSILILGIYRMIARPTTTV